MTSSASAGLIGALAVALGAFGAHGLRGTVTDAAMATYQTGVLYHIVHAAVLVALALHGGSCVKRLRWATRLFQLGILLFSGSLYVLAVTGLESIGWITPIGGLCLIGGWIALIVTPAGVTGT